MPTPALVALEHALDDVDNLMSHHPKAANPGVGRPSTDEGPLLRSCILLLYAAWEVYVEDSVLWAVEQVTAHAEPERLPAALRALVADAVRADPWVLAGAGWRTATVAEVRRLTHGDETGAFGINTAGPGQVAALHEKILGERLLPKCSWPKKSNSAVRKDLADLVRMRGAIAHTGKTQDRLSRRIVQKRQNFIERLAENLDVHLEDWVAAHLQPLGSTA